MMTRDMPSSPPPLAGEVGERSSPGGGNSFTSVSPLPNPPPQAGEGANKPRWRVEQKTRQRARALRTNSTDAEHIIWKALRAHRLNGASFRGQTPVGPYIADFVCHAAKLVIEIDGGQHFEANQMKRDARRDAYFSKGFRVLRFNNYDVMTNREGVLETIATALEVAPSPTLPRKRGREQVGARGEKNPQTVYRRAEGDKP